MTDPITDLDLCAFLDGQLDPMRRLEVEAHLARDPEAAARVMGEMSDRDALREAFAPSPGPGPERNRAAARRLDRAIGWRRAGDRARRAAVIVFLVGAGWLAHSDEGLFGGVPDTLASPVDPALVIDARNAREAAQVRARLASQPRSTVYDQAGIEAATGIDMPRLPAGWSVRDVQIVPARNGAGVEVAIETDVFGPISLYAAKVAAIRPSGEIASPGDGATAYWASGGSAYALSGGADPAALRKAALILAAAKP